MVSKELTKIQRRQCIVELLIRDFPLVIILIDLIINFILGFGAIGFQIASIILNTDLYFIGCG